MTADLDAIFTSAVFGAVYPPDIPVATVTSIKKRTSDLEPRISLKPVVNLNDLTNVTILPRITNGGPTSTHGPHGVVGQEIPLALASTPDTAILLRTQPRISSAGPVVVQIPDRAPILVYSDANTRCMTIAAPYPNGYQGACTPKDQAPTHIVGTIDTGPSITPDSTTYGAWTAVPDGTAYVTFTYGTQHTWQRPIDRVSYFAVPGATPPLGGEPVILRAFNRSGKRLGQATEQPALDGTGDWRWSP
jgi:hypothetical protein